MTNTAAAPLTFQTAASFTLAAAEARLATLKAEMVAALDDPAYALQWHGDKLTRATFRVRALSFGVLKSADAMTSLLADAVGGTGSSTSLFANAVTAAQRVEALELLSEFRRYLSADVLLDRL